MTSSLNARCGCNTSLPSDTRFTLCTTLYALCNMLYAHYALCSMLSAFTVISVDRFRLIRHLKLVVDFVDVLFDSTGGDAKQIADLFVE